MNLLSTTSLKSLPVLAVLLLSGLGSFAAAAPYLHAPSVDTYAVHDPKGVTILSNGRFLKPVGQSFPVARWPHGLAISRDGSTLFIAGAGTGEIIQDWRSPTPHIRSVTPSERKGKRRRETAGGVEFSADGRKIYWSGGDGGAIYILDTASAKIESEIPLNVSVQGKAYEDSFVVDLKSSANGRFLYCADVANFRLVIIDAEQKRVVGSLQVGRYPYALTVAGDSVYVANIGLFEYSAVPLPQDKKFDPRGLTKPPFGYPSAEARDGVEFEGRKIPGLGDANVPESFSVWRVDVSNPENPRILSRLKTGLLVGAPSENGKTVGGSAPNYLVSSGDSLSFPTGTTI